MEIDIAQPVEVITGKLHDWFNAFVSMLPNMGISVVLLILFILLAKLGKRVSLKIFSKASENKALQRLFGTITYNIIFGIGLFIILEVLNLEKAVTSLLAGIGVLGLALGFAFQDIAANFVSGVIIAFRKPYRIGDIIKINDIMGTVNRTNLRVTTVETFQGQEVYIPNKDILQNPIINYTMLGKRRIDLAVGVSYGEDLSKVEQLVKETITNLTDVIDSDKLIFDYYEFGSSSINFNIRFWIEYPNQPGYLKMRNEAIKAIKTVFDENNITIPFPIRTLDFGIKGGEKLSEMLSVAKE